MDDIVKVLANQSTDWCIANAKGTPTAWEWEFKFAELLLKECVKIAIETDGVFTSEEIKRRFKL